MQNIIESSWFGLITGIATIFTSILSLYMFLVRPIKSTMLRNREWIKSILISLSVGMMVFTFINFYNQKPPPAKSPYELDFRFVYDILHGNILQEEEGPSWEEDSTYSSSAKVKMHGYLIELETVVFFENRTRIIFRAEPQLNIIPSEDFDPFPSPVVAIGFSHPFHLMDKLYEKSNRGEIKGILEFPSLINRIGSLYLWADSEIDDNLTYDNATFVLSPPYDRVNGTLVWGILFIASAVCFIWGLIYNPIKSFKNKMLVMLNEIQEEKDSALKEILNYRDYGELPYHEKNKYDEVSQYYEKAKDALLRLMAD